MKKNLHIMGNSRKYPNKFVPDYARFLNEFVPQAKNEFVIVGDDYNVGQGFEYSVVEISVSQMFSLAFVSKKYDKVIFHSIPSRFFLLYLFFKKLSFSKNNSYLVLWGGEIHFLKKDSLRDKLNIKLNAFFMRMMKGFITYIEQDYDLAVKMSGNKKANWINIQSIYPSNVVQCNKISNSGSGLKVLIGTSALKGNRHHDIIDIIANAGSAAEVEFIIPLSYGSKEYADKVVSYAEKKLNGKVTPLRDFMPIEQYTQILSTIHLALFMHDGQQGMGNIRNLLAFGANVYMKSDSISYQYCAGLGFKVYDMQAFSKFVYDKETEQNVQLAQKVFSKALLIEQSRDFLAND